MEQIILYSTGCPKCIVLEKKLNAKDIKYTKITDVNEIKAAGFYEVPVLKINDEYYTFTDAVAWVNGRN